MIQLNLQLVIVIVLLAPLNALATINNTDYYPTGRYTSIAITPTEEQTDLLAAVILQDFPSDVATVGDALHQLLSTSGFRLVSVDQNDNAQTLLFNLTLPQAHRRLGPMPLRTAIAVLGAPAFKPVIDPVKRTISYQLLENYKHLVTDQDIQAAKAQWAAYQAKNVTSGKPVSKTEEACYGPVKPGETLLGIAMKLGLTGVTRSQVAIGLLRANPTAFIEQNINQLLAGSLLTIPSLEIIRTISAKSASHTVRQQDQQWQSLRLIKDK